MLVGMATTPTPNPNQIIAPGERYWTSADSAALLDPELDVARIFHATVDGVGVFYNIHPRRDPDDGYLVSYLPAGPATLRRVVVADTVTWEAAMDLVRDRVAAELEAERS